MTVVTGSQIVGSGSLAFAVNVVFWWLLGEYAGTNAPSYVSEATVLILSALFLWIGPYIPKRPVE
jgi:hypothetical protein